MAETTDDSLLGGRLHLLQAAGGHRAGTDAVLLAAAAGARPDEAILDAGAATGAVGLMVAMMELRAAFTFIERNPDLAQLCRENCVRNGIVGEVAAADLLDKASLQETGIYPQTFDLVLTNPPFLEEGRARLSPDPAKAAAHSLPVGGLKAWLNACLSLLKPKGRLVLIHRADRVGECLGYLRQGVGAHLRFIHPSEDQPAIRVLITAMKASRAPLRILPPVILNDTQGRFTPLAEALHRGEARLA